MRKAIGALALVLGLALSAHADIYVPLDEDPFDITQKDQVRVTATGIAGATITVKVLGPAKHTATPTHTVRKGMVLIGVSKESIDVHPTGKGKVTVIVTITPPQMGAMPKVEKYNFEVR